MLRRRRKKPIRDLEAQLRAAVTMFSMFPVMSRDERAEVADALPRDLAMVAWRAVEAGFAIEARALVRAYANAVPGATSPETWRLVMAPSRQVVGLGEAG